MRSHHGGAVLKAVQPGSSPAQPVREHGKQTANARGAEPLHRADEGAVAHPVARWYAYAVVAGTAALAAGLCAAGCRVAAAALPSAPGHFSFSFSFSCGGSGAAPWARDASATEGGSGGAGQAGACARRFHLGCGPF
eukprot:COSAG01_NODE_5604_length_4152_cov_2.350851_1_plen_137_part_00